MRDYFECRQAWSQGFAGLVQQIDSRGYTVQCHEGSERRFGLWKQLERGRCDDAERAFAAHVQVAQVIARVVLAQAAQAIPDRSLGGHDFQAQGQVAHIPVAQDGVAASIGSQVAPDRATTFGCQGQREQALLLQGCFLQLRQHHSCLDDDGVIGSVDLADPVQPRGGHHDLIARGVGGRAAR